MSEENIGMKVIYLENQFDKAYSFVKVLYNAVTSEAPMLSNLELEHQLKIALCSMDNFRELLEDFTNYCEIKMQEANKL